MPLARNHSYQQGAEAANQESYLQTVLANTRATQQQTAQLKAKQEEQEFDPESLNGPDVSPEEFARRKTEVGGFASGARPGPDGRDRFLFKDSTARDNAISFMKTKTGERQAVSGDKATAAQFRQMAMNDPRMLVNGKLRPEAERHLQVLEGTNPLDPNRAEARKTISEWNEYKATVAKGGLGVDARGVPLVENAQSRNTVAPKPSDDDHKIVRKWDADGNSSYAEEPKKGSDYWNEAIALAESGVPQDDPRIVKLVAKANYGRAPFVPEGAAPFNKAEWDLSKIKPAGVSGTPPAGAAAAVGQVTGEGAAQGGAQAAAWLRERAKNPAVAPDERAALLKAATAAEQVQTAGKAQVAAASAPTAPAAPAPAAARQPGVGEIINKKPGDAAQLKQAAEFDETLASIETVRKYFDDPEVKTFRGENGAWPQLKMRGQAKAQDWSGFQTGVPENVQASRAALIAAVAAFRRATSGVNVTVNESSFLENLLASDASDPAIKVKLAIFEGMVERNRQGLDETLKASNRQAIPRVRKQENPNEPKSTLGETQLKITRNGRPGSILLKDFDARTDVLVETKK